METKQQGRFESSVKRKIKNNLHDHNRIYIFSFQFYISVISYHSRLKLLKSQIILS